MKLLQRPYDVILRSIQFYRWKSMYAKTSLLIKLEIDENPEVFLGTRLKNPDLE